MLEYGTQRGFQAIAHDVYPPLSLAINRAPVTKDLVIQSSVVGDYDDAMIRPGTSALWIGSHHHLNREEVAQLRDYLTRWLETGRLFEKEQQ